MHIVSVAARCAVGLTAPSVAAAIRAGIRRIAEHPRLIDAAGDNLRCAREPSIHPLLFGPRRIALLGERCLREIAASLTQTRPLAGEVPLLVALPETRPGFSVADADRVKDSLASLSIPGMGTLRPQLIGQGHAGFFLALRRGIELLAKQQHDLVVVGGIDSYLDLPTVDWLDADDRISRKGIRNGFIPGEGAAMLAVASRSACRWLGAPLALVRDVACAQEKRSPVSDVGLLGEALTQAVLGATGQLRLPQELISDVFGDINGERARTEDWGLALMRTADRFRDGTGYVTHTAACGDVGAASGALSCVLAVQAWRRAYANGSRALAWGGSWSGLRGVAVLERAVQ